MYRPLQNSPSVNVRCAFSKKEMIGPYFFEDGNVTGSRYKRRHRYFLLPKLRDYPEKMIFKKDGTPPHSPNEVRKYLERKLPGVWMGRGGPISSPVRSTKLTPSDYYLGGHIKDILYTCTCPG